jgi:lysophospholipase L1-like esterase
MQTLSRRLLQPALALLGACSVALLGAELALARFAQVSYHRPVQPTGDPWSRLHRAGSIPGLEYELMPDAAVEIPDWGTTVHTNALGMRGPAVARAKPEGVVRIAAVGDSFTFGLGVADDQTFPSHLQTLLEGALGSGRCEVLNFGVSGYSSAEEALVVRDKALAFDPDLILLCYVLNDPEVHSDQPVHLAYHPTELWQRFNLTRLLAEAREDRDIARHGDWFRYLHHEPRHWSTVVAAFHDVRDACADAGVPVVLVLMPLVDGATWEPYQPADLNAQVADEGRANGFEVLDLRIFLAELCPSPRSLRLPRDAHANGEGNALFALVLCDYLLQRHPNRD